MGKYDRLTRYLSGLSDGEVSMSFEDIEQVLGVPLPASKQYPAWWSNNPSNNVMTKAWLEAGFRTERVDIGREKLVFRRAEQEAGAARPGIRPEPLVETLRRRLAGSVTIPQHVDVTAPAGDAWDAER